MSQTRDPFNPVKQTKTMRLERAKDLRIHRFGIRTAQYLFTIILLDEREKDFVLPRGGYIQGEPIDSPVLQTHNGHSGMF